jgi:hypothetical protein
MMKFRGGRLCPRRAGRELILAAKRRCAGGAPRLVYAVAGGAGLRIGHSRQPGPPLMASYRPTFIGERCPELIPWCGEVRAVPFNDRPGLCYLDKPEMDALLAAPDNTTEGGRRDHSLLLFLYNTGARASEAAAVAVRDLDVRPDGSGSVRLVGSTRESTTQSQRSACASCTRRGRERCSTGSWCCKASTSSDHGAVQRNACSPGPPRPTPGGRRSRKTRWQARHASLMSPVKSLTASWFLAFAAA